MAKKEAPPLKLSSARPVKRVEIPSVQKSGVIATLDGYKDLLKIAAYVKEHGASPYEAFDLVDFAEEKKKNPELAKMKTLVTGFVLKAREVLKQFQVEKKLNLTVRKERVFLESME